MCGENFLCLHRKYCHFRITPACAGKTCPCRSTYSHTEDHPRVCGENLQILTKVTILSGSPPRVRGKPAKVTKNGTDVRITPACAGKTFSILSEICGEEDHPRVCGENFLSS